MASEKSARALSIISGDASPTSNRSNHLARNERTGSESSEDALSLPPIHHPASRSIRVTTRVPEPPSAPIMTGGANDSVFEFIGKCHGLKSAGRDYLTGFTSAFSGDGA